jgi:uncharacterized radical SAM superfamily Fe-S cluster-containing enzyme
LRVAGRDRLQCKGLKRDGSGIDFGEENGEKMLARRMAEVFNMALKRPLKQRMAVDMEGVGTMVSYKQRWKEKIEKKSWELPCATESLCPVCVEVVEGRLYEEGGQVFMEKSCAEHGAFKELISSDAEFFLKIRRRHYERASGVENPNCENTRGCPEGCGLCEEHLSTPSMVNIDLTNRCNQHCPICFASSNTRGRVYEASLEQVRRMLELGRGVRPHPASCLQYVGGEPTIHPDFIEAVRLAKPMGFAQIQVASNGVRFAQSLEFAQAAAEAGLGVVYLQFDGMSDEVYKRTRGRPLLETKLRAVENIGKAGMRVALVPTIVKGVNDGELGAILRFAIERVDVTTAISWQPVAITGRIEEWKRQQMRFTTADLARCLAEQTDFMEMHRDWYPFSVVAPFVRLMEAVKGSPQMRVSCHPDCGCATYLVVDKETGKATPLPSFVDIEATMATLDKAAERIERHPWLKNVSVMSAMRSMRKYFHEERAPVGWGFEQFLEFVRYFVEFTEITSDKESYFRGLKRGRFGMLLLASMHFQDCYNYEVERSRRCVILYAAPNGRLYPFCTWNSGPCHRYAVERAFSKPIGKIKERAAKVRESEKATVV